MDGSAVFRDYDQAQLDAQYDNRARVPAHAAHNQRWEGLNETATDGLATSFDLAYGPSPAETVDVLAPEGAHGLPIQVFFHGGYWMARSKRDFRFLAPALTAAGAIVVMVDYALVPEVDLDELVRQCRAAVAWTHRHASSLGGDAGRIFVSGHSAGGHLVSMMMATDWPDFAGLPADVVKGGVALSGLFDLEPIRLCYLNDSLRLEARMAARNSPVHLQVPAPGAPLVLALGGDESDEYHRQSQDLAAAWSAQGVPCQVMARPGRNHFTIVDDFNHSATPLGRATRAQMGLA